MDQNGVAALKLLNEHDPHLIMTDMRMPGMDGWAFVRAYRQLPRQQVPVVVITAARDAAASAQEVSADAFLGKPFRLDDQLDLVSQYTA